MNHEARQASRIEEVVPSTVHLFLLSSSTLPVRAHKARRATLPARREGA